MMTLKSLSGDPRNVVKYVRNEREAGDKRKTGYYQKGATPSVWSGELARELGLKGPVSDKDLLALLDGQLPSGERFAESDPARRMGIDCTFSAPKGVSLAALASDLPQVEKDAIIRAHHEAVAEAQAFLEKEFLCARYKQGGKEVVKTGKALWATFLHEDARPVDGKVAPQIHSHGLLLNATRGRDGKLRAIDLQFGQDGLKLSGAVYQSSLAAKMRAQGRDLRRTEDGGWDLASVSDAQIEAASPRSAQIEADLARKGLDRETATASQKTASNLSTRESKLQLSQEEQRWEWRKLAREIDLHVEPPTPNAERVVDPEHEPVSAADALKYATDHLSERESVINKQSTQLHALRAGYLDGVTIDTLNKEIDAAHADGNLIDAGAGKLVTRETLAREAFNLSTVSVGRGAMVPLTDEAGAEARISERKRINGFEFTASQREAVLRVLTTSDQCIVIRGAAGAGKSTSLAAVADEARARGYRVVGTGPSQTAVDGTKDVNPDDARVLASFNVREEKDPTPRVILLDECGMVSSRDMQAFFKKVRPQDKVVFVGDDLQLAAVEAGSPMSQFMKEKVVEVVEIDEIVRQKDAGLLAVAQAFARGRNEEATRLAAPYMTTVTVTDADYEAADSSKSDAMPVNGPMPNATRGMMQLVKAIRKKHKDIPAPSAHEFKTVREWLDTHSRTELGFEAKVLAPQAVRMQAIARETAQAYLEWSKTERDKTLVLAATNEMRRAINEKVKAGLQEQVPEGADIASVTVTALDKSQCTKAQRREAINYKVGMVLRVPEGRGRAKRVVDWTITATDPTRNTITARNRDGEEKVFKPRDLDSKEVGLYSKRDLDIDVGDRVVFTENRRTDGYQNNETGTVVEIGSDKVTIRKDSGDQVDLAFGDMHAVDHGWAVTVHRSQGRTVDRALVAGMSSKRATANLAYVACSRERFNLQIYTDNVKSLQKAWARVAERETAKDAVEKAARARETAPLEAAREAVRAEVREQIEKVRQEREAIEQEPEAKPEPVREREPERERELGDSYGW